MLRLAKFSAGILAATVFYVTPAHAQASRTWVSGVGDDVNPCSRTAPCKTFAGAISKTAPGGEINCLDPAGFGAVTITKSITIDCTGTLGGILASSTTGVILNGAGIIVSLRGLEINGGPPNLPGVNGIRFLQGTSLTVEDSTIYNFLGASPNGFGIIVNATSGAEKLVVSNTTIRNNGASNLGGGIMIRATGSATVRASLHNVRMVNNSGSGFMVDTTGNTSAAGVTVTMEDVLLSGNSVHGISVLTPFGTTSSAIMVNGSQIDNNAFTGISTNGGTSIVRVGGTTITGNAGGIQAVGGSQILTFGNNRLVGNNTTGAPNDGVFSGPVPPS